MSAKPAPPVAKARKGPLPLVPVLSANGNATRPMSSTSASVFRPPPPPAQFQPTHPPNAPSAAAAVAAPKAKEPTPVSMAVSKPAPAAAAATRAKAKPTTPTMAMGHEQVPGPGPDKTASSGNAATATLMALPDVKMAAFVMSEEQLELLALKAAEKTLALGIHVGGVLDRARASAVVADRNLALARRLRFAARNMSAANRALRDKGQHLDNWDQLSFDVSAANAEDDISQAETQSRKAMDEVRSVEALVGNVKYLKDFKDMHVRQTTMEMEKRERDQESELKKKRGRDRHSRSRSRSPLKRRHRRSHSRSRSRSSSKKSRSRSRSRSRSPTLRARSVPQTGPSEPDSGSLFAATYADDQEVHEAT